jgi:hypothetical protein
MYIALAFFVGMVIGACIGVLFMCIFIAGARPEIRREDSNE